MLVASVECMRVRFVLFVCLSVRWVRVCACVCLLQTENELSGECVDDLCSIIRANPGLTSLSLRGVFAG